MATYVFSGGATPIAQVDTLTVGGTVEAGDKFKMTIGGKTLSVSATAATTTQTATDIATAWNASTIPEFAEITAAAVGSTVTLTADTAGKPFTVTVTTTESDDTAADLQTFVRAATTANSGPNTLIAGNLVNTATGAVAAALPIAGDTLIFENLATDLLYNLDALAAVTLAAVEVRASYTGNIGLPRHTGAYDEYRPEYFQVGSTLLKVGHGEGSGSARIKIDNLAVAATVSVRHTATSTENGVPAFLWKGTNVANTMQVARGSVGVAIFAGETAQLADLNIGYRDSRESDAQVTCGAGVTFPAASTIDKSGGILNVASSIITILQTAGETVIAGDSLNITTATVQGGDLKYASNGTITNLNVGGEGITAQVIFSGDDLRARTVTNCNCYGSDFAIIDEYRTVAWTNGVRLNRTGTGSNRLRLGENISLAVTSL